LVIETRHGLSSAIIFFRNPWFISGARSQAKPFSAAHSAINFLSPGTLGKIRAAFRKIRTRDFPNKGLTSSDYCGFIGAD
jgi:hypothetical protein